MDKELRERWGSEREVGERERERERERGGVAGGVQYD